MPETESIEEMLKEIDFTFAYSTNKQELEAKRRILEQRKQDLGCP